MASPQTFRQSFRQRLDALEERLLSGEALDGLGTPEELEQLLHVELASILRQGPGQRPTPEDLIRGAAQAVDQGLIHAGAARDLEKSLQGNTDLLRKALGERFKPWFHGTKRTPGPERTPRENEKLWLDLDALGPLWSRAPSDGEPWSTGSWFPEEQTRTLCRDLEAAYQDGRLGLERATVGRGRQSVRRTDAVRYVTGYETDLLAEVPRVAVLVQWLRKRLVRQLEKLWRRPLAAPESVMLARYPAPSAGYAPHLDNPGGRRQQVPGTSEKQVPGTSRDNGRSLAFLLYLTTPTQGGELVVWRPDEKTSADPAAVFPVHAGMAACFDARKVPHAVRPLGLGEPRWSLVLWLQDGPSITLPKPRLGLTELLLPVPDPPLPEGTVLFHQLDTENTAGEIAVRSNSSVQRADQDLRCGVVATVYNGGSFLETWCAHHLAAGMDQLVLVFDRLEGSAEAKLAEKLQSGYPPDRLTVLSGAELAQRWAPDAELRSLAAGGGAAWAVAARQALNATAVLEMARNGLHLDWLLHIDGDELFYPQGASRGGGNAKEHFHAATQSGLSLIRYVNHEILATNAQDARPRFKLNPRLATALLGPAGWAAISQRLRVPSLFNAYQNGKSAVRVAAADAAAGVHSWRLREDSESPETVVAGPSILHFHFTSAPGFARKYLAMADAADAADAATASPERPFPPSPAEEQAVALIRDLRQKGATQGEILDGLAALHRDLVLLPDEDVELLSNAGLLLEPDLDV